MAPIALYSRLRDLKEYYTGTSTNKPPAISPSSAALLSAAFTVLYVLPLYLSKTTRPSPTLSRDAPSIIRARIRAISSACAVITVLSIYIILQYEHASPLETLRLLGWWPISPVAVLQTVLLCSILFVGPLFEAAFVKGRLGAWVRGTYIRETFGSWTGWRNLVAGPVTEELVFRSLIIPLHLMAKISPTRIVFVTPLYFGIAHIHHFYEFLLTHPDFPILPAIIRTLVQFAYTSLFGFFAAFVFLRTGSLFAAIAAHTFCNWMGLPKFWGRIGVQAGVPIGPPGSKKSDDASSDSDDASTSANTTPVKVAPRRDLSTLYTSIYYLLLFAGMYGFKTGLWPLTASSSALAGFPQDKKGS